MPIDPNEVQVSSVQKLLGFISKLDERKIYYKLFSARHEAIMVEVASPGERWEIEFFADGQVEVEVFSSSSDIEDEKSLERLFAQYND